jgi:hypothetical protein
MAILNGNQKKSVASALKRFGLTRGIRWLAANRGLKVSLGRAYSVAKEFNITFKAGRPLKKKAKKDSSPPATPKLSKDDQEELKKELRENLDCLASDADVAADQAEIDGIDPAAGDDDMNPGPDSFTPLPLGDGTAQDDLSPEQRQALDKIELLLDQPLRDDPNQPAKVAA